MFEKIASMLGGSVFTGVSEVISKFVTDPTKLMEANAELEKLKANTETRLAELAIQDRASARAREIAVKDWTPAVLGWSIVIGYFSVQWFLLNHIVPTEMREVILRTLGTLDMALGLVLGYYYGSSSSSDKKTGALVGQLNKE